MTKCGFVAIIGRPNVGKSTLLNKFIGKKISITSNKPQTTRHKIIGVKTEGENQIVFIDTPGMHLHQKKAINKAMNKSAKGALSDVDVILFMIDSLKWTDEDEMVLELVKKVKVPVFLLINKIDKISDKDELLPHIEQLNTKYDFNEIIPISVFKDTQIVKLKELIFNLLPDSPHYFPQEQITDKSKSFQLAEIVREKLTRFLGDELPYALAVQIEKIQKEKNFYMINCLIWVEKESQKQIVIGKQGAKLKEIGTLSRIDMQKLLDSKVHLKLWVKVKEGWSDNESSLEEFGYIDI